MRRLGGVFGNGDFPVGRFFCLCRRFGRLGQRKCGQILQFIGKLFAFFGGLRFGAVKSADDFSDFIGNAAERLRRVAGAVGA